MNKNDDSNVVEIDDIEIVDLDPRSDGEPLANNLIDKGQNGAARNIGRWHFKPWLRRGMAVTIFGGCIALCLLLWPDIVTIFPGVLLRQVSTPTPTIPNPLVGNNPLLTNIFVFGDTAYISTFTYSQSSSTRSGRLDAIHIRNGQPFWHAPNSVIATPVLANGIIFIPATDGIYALRAHDRVMLWHTTNPATIYRIDNGLIYTQPFQGYGFVVQTGAGSPTPFAQGSKLEALRVRDGSVAWQHITDPFISYVGEALGIVYISTYDANGDTTNTNTDSPQSRLDAIRVSDGSVLWSKEGANVIDISSAGNSLVCLTNSPQSSGNTQNSFSIVVLRRNDGKEMWYKDTIQSIWSVEQGMLYTTLQVGATPRVIALRLSDGSILWQKNVIANEAVEKIGNMLYLFSPSQTSTNNVTALNARNGKTVWQKDMPGYSATLAGSAVYSLSNRSLDAWQASNGSHLWQNKDIQLSQPGFFSSIATNGVFYVITNNGWVIYAIQISDGKTLWDYEEPLLA